MGNGNPFLLSSNDTSYDDDSSQPPQLTDRS